MISLTEIFRFPKKSIAVYAFHGPSGTGKSFRAKLVAQKYGIKAIIDDGLLIVEDSIAAGHSAKLEENYMGAVRVALFDDKEHRDQVAKTIRDLKIKKILILGTSEKMVGKIAMRLQLPTPEKYITINEIATPDQIAEAQRSRLIEGKHVIPVRANAVKSRNYSRIFYDSVLVSLSKKKIFSKFVNKMLNQRPVQTPDANAKLYEKSVVRPSFSKKDRKAISQAALARMTVHDVHQFNKFIRIKRLSIKTIPTGYRFILTIDVPFGVQLTQFSGDLKQYIINKIEKVSSILVEDISIVIDKILIPESA